jgi:hypothetical protein
LVKDAGKLIQTEFKNTVTFARGTFRVMAPRVAELDLGPISTHHTGRKGKRDRYTGAGTGFGNGQERPEMLG